MIPRAYRAAKWREGMQLLDSEIFIVTKIRGYTHQLLKSRKRAVANDETTVPPTPVVLAPRAVFSVFVDTHLDTTIHCCSLFSSKRRLLRHWVSRTDCSAQIQLDLSANVPLFVYLEMNSHLALVNKSELECHAVHRHDRRYFCWCASHCNFPIPVNDLT